MNLPKVYHTSAGGVVMRKSADGYEVCLIRRERYRKEEWCLPKGHVEPGEDIRTAALREVIEETGLEAEILDELGSIRYCFEQIQKGRTCDKTVHFMLMAARSHVLKPLDTTEVVEAAWVNVDAAIEELAYPNERHMLEQAKQLLDREDIASKITETLA